MAINITIEGNQFKIVDGSGLPNYINLDDSYPSITGDKVSLSNGKTNIIESRLFSDFATPSGASATAVADAISALSGITLPSGVPIESQPANTANKVTQIWSVTNVQLLAARPKRISVTIRNATDKIADIRLGVSAAVSLTEAIQIAVGASKTIESWDGAIQVIFEATGTGNMYAEEIYIV